VAAKMIASVQSVRCDMHPAVRRVGAFRMRLAAKSGTPAGAPRPAGGLRERQIAVNPWVVLRGERGRGCGYVLQNKLPARSPRRIVKEEVSWPGFRHR